MDTTPLALFFALAAVEDEFADDVPIRWPLNEPVLEMARAMDAPCNHWRDQVVIVGSKHQPTVELFGDESLVGFSGDTTTSFNLEGSCVEDIFVNHVADFKREGRPIWCWGRDLGGDLYNHVR